MLYTATYDVQSLSLEEEGGGVLVRGEFMSGSPDIFRALLRTQSQDTGHCLHHCTCPSLHLHCVMRYDLEENGLPNTMPAIYPSREPNIAKLRSGIQNFLAMLKALVYRC